MKRQEELEQLKQEYENTEVPEQTLEAIQRGIARARQEEQADTRQTAVVQMEKRSKQNRQRRNPAVPIAAAAAMLALLIVPNVNPNVAMAVEDVPVLNKIIELVTFDRFEAVSDDQNQMAAVETPKLAASGDAMLQSSVGEINAEVQAHAEQMIAVFQQHQAQLDDGVYGLDMTYHVVTDTDTWFTLQIITTETQASGAETLHYYNLDKTTGQYVQLADLFPQDADYVTAISETIKEQMRQRMEEDASQVYFIDSDVPEDDFQQIAADQNFYINQDGQLVIAFNEYEAAPGSMGCPEFVIADAIVQALQGE